VTPTAKRQKKKKGSCENEAEGNQRRPSTQRALFSDQYSKLDDEISSLMNIATEKNLPPIEILSLPVV